MQQPTPNAIRNNPKFFLILLSIVAAAHVALLVVRMISLA